MKKLLLLFVAFLSIAASAQRPTCGYTQKVKELMEKDPEFALRHTEAKEFLANADISYRNNGSASPTVVITIPVVFHVLYKNASQNISEAQINSQLTILNNDFRKLNADFSSVVPAVYQPLGADVEIMFCKATQDPNGNPTTGITRKQVPASFVFENSYYTPAGQPAWNPFEYLNIWIGRFSSPDLLGFAYPPANVGNVNDGLCIGDQYFGNTGTALYPFNKGRTATHEIGHYFGLEHIWGDDYSTCGSVANSDGVADTPATKNPYYNCPNFPDFSNACAVTGPGPMHMNYMDYVNDACMAFFTNGQKTRMHQQLNFYRSGLLTSNGCNSLSVDEVTALNAIRVYPNPVSTHFMIASPHVEISRVDIFNMNGQHVMSQDLDTPQNRVGVDELESGVYYVRIYRGNEFIKAEKLIKK